MNKVMLVGNLTKDPELKYAAGSGIAVCKFTVAVNRFKKEDGADFISCVAFNKVAEAVANYLTKGRKVSVVGRIQTGSYDAQDGTKRYTTEVAVENIEFLSNKSKNDESAFADDGIPF